MDMEDKEFDFEAYIKKGRIIDDDLVYDSYHVVEVCHYSNLIICSKTGIFFDHQYNHLCCSHTKIEGFPLLVNVSNVYNPCGFIGDLNEGSVIYEANQVNESLKDFKDSAQNMIEKLEFDYERINKFREGLIPVNVWMKKYFRASIMSGDELWKTLEPRLMKGYLFLENCD